MQFLRRQFQELLTTYNERIRLPSDADDKLRPQLLKDKIRRQRVFLQYMKLHIWDLEQELSQREAGVSRQANIPKPAGDKEMA